MKLKEIEDIVKIADQIRSFRECYHDSKLWSSPPDGDVQPERLLEWLIENPCFAQMAETISKLRKNIK